MIPGGHLRELIDQAREGDEASFEKLLDELRPQLLGVARQYADPDQGADSTSDLVQEAAVRVWQALDQFRGADDAEDTEAVFRAWVQQIVHRTGLNVVRQRKAAKRKPREAKVQTLQVRLPQASSAGSHDPAASGTTPSGNAMRSERALLVRAALERVDSDLSRRIVTMRFFDGLSLREISEKVGLGYEATRDRYRRAMRVVEGSLGEIES